jgi:hypothetical protein
MTGEQPQPKAWTTQEILHELFTTVQHGMQTRSQSFIPLIEEAVKGDSPDVLEQRLNLIQEGVVLDVLALIEGLTGPTVWPGLSLVNAETGEMLTEFPTWDWAAFKSELP